VHLCSINAKENAKPERKRKREREREGGGGGRGEETGEIKHKRAAVRVKAELRKDQRQEWPFPM